MSLHVLSQRELGTPVYQVRTLQSLERTSVSHVVCELASRQHMSPVPICASVGTGDRVLGAVCGGVVFVQQSALYILSTVLTRDLIY